MNAPLAIARVVALMAAATGLVLVAYCLVWPANAIVYGLAGLHAVAALDRMWRAQL